MLQITKRKPDLHQIAACRSVLHVALHLSRSGAGLARAAWELGIGQRDLGLRTSWACLEDEHLAADIPSREPSLARAIRAYPAMGPRQLVLSRQFRAGVAPTIVDSDVVHVHGTWSAPCHVAGRLARRYNVPYLVTPHGMLDPWALRHRKWRKRVARWLVERTYLERSSCVHALVEREYHDIRRFGCTKPVAVIPNGIDLAPFDQVARARRIHDRWPQLHRRRLAVFLSRIHPKKGLPILLEAWARVVRRHPDWYLVVAGPDEGGHAKKLAQMAHRLEIEDQLMFTGPLYGEDKVALLQSAEFFTLASHSEGFSMAVLEAMAARLPVVITSHCNFPEVERVGAGHIVADQVSDVSNGLDAMMECGPGQLADMGARGRALVERKYTWTRVAKQMNAVYQWLVGGGTPPECVVTR